MIGLFLTLALANIPWSYGTPAPEGYVNSHSWGGYIRLIKGDYAGWATVPWQWANATGSYSIRVVDDKDGYQAYEFIVGKNDDPMGLSSHAPRAEFDSVDPAAQRLDDSLQKAYLIDGQTGERWYIFYLYVPSKSARILERMRWATVFQHHTDHRHPMAGSGSISIHGRSLDFSHPRGGDWLYRMTLPVDRWVQLGLYVRWSYWQDGRLQWYVDGQPVGSMYEGPIMDEGVYQYLKQGLYLDYGTMPDDAVHILETPLMETMWKPEGW